ncbi:hypothetical protein [Leptolyngbya sp. GGD]|uniref:hypothetical protein n=1 Tax=Leptolyngbya sp. GGD TaxID=2997907 RepID=UPI00227D68A7|nr:hypothetical protein [Leptolyngbya sp. GGD]MCY6494549.1 hypothetical protein [Leptolyngbya sp. GGD]
MESKTLGDFLWRISIDYVRYGYTRYVLREIPEEKDLEAIDQKLTQAYSVSACRVTRHRQRTKGLASVQYLRFQRRFVLLATQGTHPEFDRLCSYDIRTCPLHFEGYSIGIIGKRSCVRVARRQWRLVEIEMLALATRDRAKVETAFNTLPYYNFPGVVEQKLKLVKKINALRKPKRLPSVKIQIPITDVKGAYIRRRLYKTP